MSRIRPQAGVRTVDGDILEFRVRKNLLIFGCWTAYGLVMAFRYIVTQMLLGRRVESLRILAGELAYAWLWAAATPLLWRVSARFPVHKWSEVRRLLLHATLACAFALSIKLVWDIVFLPVLHPSWVPATTRAAVGTVIGAMDFGILNYTLIVMAEHAVAYLSRWRQSLVQSERLAKLLAEARLQTLQMQLEPHFLFNTLQSISQLVHEDPDTAERMLALLGDMLRKALACRNGEEIPLREELNLLHQYVDIQQVRFRGRLEVRWLVDPVTENAAIPPMLMQPLVENAFRHGLNGYHAVDVLEIQCVRREDRLHIEIHDNGPGESRRSEDGDRQGLGLRNVAQRLQYHYGAEQSFRYGTAGADGFRVTLEIPFQLHENLSSADR